MNAPYHGFRRRSRRAERLCRIRFTASVRSDFLCRGRALRMGSGRSETWILSGCLGAMLLVLMVPAALVLSLGLAIESSCRQHDEAQRRELADRIDRLDHGRIVVPAWEYDLSIDRCRVYRPGRRLRWEWKPIE